MPQAHATTTRSNRALRASLLDRLLLGAAVLLSITVVAFAGQAAFPQAASASNLVDRNATRITLKVDHRNTALVEYNARGKRHHVLYWGAKNRKLFFRYDRSGGWKSKRADWRKFKNRCRRYNGPRLRTARRANLKHPMARLHAICRGPDGSYWALQSWERLVKNYGGRYGTAPRELRISRWTGWPANLTGNSHWIYQGAKISLMGELKFKGRPWSAKSWASNGSVTDGIGRNLVIDSYGSDMGPGWRRVNAILTHKPKGIWCLNLNNKPIAGTNRMSGTGMSPVGRYRIGVAGPGVSPDVFRSFRGVLPENYDAANDTARDNIIVRWLGGVGSAYWTDTAHHGCKIWKWGDGWRR